MTTLPSGATTRAPLSPAALFDALRDWRYEGGKRDLRFDLLRGCAVFAMIADHASGGNSFLSILTGGDHFFVSAAECFVFLSGLLMGIVNGGLIRRGDVDVALAKVRRRAGMLYAITVGLSLVTAALPVALGLPGRPDIGELSLVEYIVGIFTLHRTSALVDVMLLYTVLVLITEPVLLLLDRGYTRLVLGASWSLWLIWQCWPQQALSLPFDSTALFQVSAWQVLFMNALVIGFHRRKLERAFRAVASPQALVIAGAVLGGMIALHLADLAPLARLVAGGDPAVVTEWLFAKHDVGAGRIVTFAALIVFAFALASLCWRPLVRALGWLLLPLGQSALSAYVIHIFIVLPLGTVRTALLGPARTTWGNTAIQLVVVFIVWAAIKLRPVLAASLEQHDSPWAVAATAHAEVAPSAESQALAIDVRIAQAEAYRGMELR